MAKFGLGITSNLLVVLRRLEEEFLLLGCGLAAQRGLETLDSLTFTLDCCNKYQVHSSVQTVRARLADQLVCHYILVIVPVVLELKLAQSLGPGQRPLESVFSTIVVVARLVKHLLGLQNLQYVGLAVQMFLGEHEIGQLLDVQVRLRPLSLEQVGALWGSWSEVFDPLRSFCHFDVGFGYFGCWQ